MGSKRPTAWSFRLNSYMQRWTPSANSSRSCGSSTVSTAKAHETFATSERSTTSYGHGIGVWHWDALGLHSKPYDISILHTQGPQFDQPNSLGLSESRILQNPTVDHQTLPIEMTISGGTSLTCAHQNDSLAPRFMYTYLHVQKQPFTFRLGLGDLGLGGDVATRRQGVGIKV